ncbi:MAG: tetratricopeptide repeat protein [Bacteroidaceae bacterium]|nr:tetratricopeptide repeat protein [Bacteroidaceae bacterium]
MNRLFIILFAFFLSAPSFASVSVKEMADAEYRNENYLKASQLYEQVLKEGESADVYYNLGNAYYRQDNFSRAILNYERAQLLSPGSSDIRYNLDMARSKTVDKITPRSEMFFVTWYKALVSFQSADAWGTTAIVCFVLMLVAILCYVLFSNILLRKVGFSVACLMLVVVVLSNVFAFQLRSRIDNRTSAIVTSNSVAVRSTPNRGGTELFVLHAGTKLEVLDEGIASWREVELEDGRVGWIPAGSIEKI